MYILQHNPMPCLDALLDSFISQFKTFGTADGNRMQLSVGLFGQLLDFEAWVEARCT